MKLLINSIIIILLLMNFACKSTYPSSEVNYIDNVGKDILIVAAKGYGNNQRVAMNDAEKRAFKTLFFKGIPNSSYRFGMMPNKETEKQYFLQAFFDTQKHREFIVASNITSPISRNQQKKAKELVLEVQINTLSLRKYLEHQDVVHKFGF